MVEIAEQNGYQNNFEIVLEELVENISERDQLHHDDGSNVVFRWLPSNHQVNSRYINSSGWYDTNIRRFNVVCNWEKDIPANLCKECKAIYDWVNDPVFGGSFIENGYEHQKRYSMDYQSDLQIPKRYCYSNGTTFFNGPQGHRCFKNPNPTSS